MGGNEPQTLEAFRSARSALTQVLADTTSSGLYRTAPQLDTEQDDFWNAVVSGLWAGDAWELLGVLQALEVEAGRKRSPSRPKGPRVLDLDILLFGQQILVSDRLQVPHPGLRFRRFALEPLLELAPQSVDPTTGERLSVVCDALAGQGVERCAETW